MLRVRATGFKTVNYNFHIFTVHAIVVMIISYSCNMFMVQVIAHYENDINQFLIVIDTCGNSFIDF